ncbi:MAG: hypothetical protein Q4G40_09785 [Brachybacterium sp.]|nr:hypothetical protein [Brachybacterium sp.]
MSTEDPLHQDTPRRPGDFGLNTRRLRRVRLIVFAVLAVPLLLLTALALKFTSMPLAQAWHNAAYEDERYAVAIERLDPLWPANWFEPYLPHLSRGTDLLQQGEDAAAEEELRESLRKWEEGSDLNQPLHAQCKILNNLAISIERQADDIEDPAERADRLFEAELLLEPCLSGGGGGEGDSEGEPQSGNEDQETTDGNGDRVEEKRREADEEAGNDPDDREKPSDPGPDQEQDPDNEPRRDGDDPEQEEESPTPDTDGDREDELDQRNRDANQGGDGDDEGEGGPEDPERPW